jgi:uncharacterized DUF497 family protein
VRVEWDPVKAATNLRKHGVAFSVAASVLEDGLAVTVIDDALEEQRWVTVGLDQFDRLLVVTYTWRDAALRLISARTATPRERRQYEEGR